MHAADLDELKSTLSWLRMFDVKVQSISAFFFPINAVTAQLLKKKVKYCMNIVEKNSWNQFCVAIKTSRVTVCP